MQIQLDGDPSKGIQIPTAVEEPLDSKGFDLPGMEIENKMRLLHSQCRSFRPSACINSQTPVEWMFMESDIEKLH
jgi:hypothetical protein